MPPLDKPTTTAAEPCCQMIAYLGGMTVEDAKRVGSCGCVQMRASLDAETRRADDNDDARKKAEAERDELRAALTEAIACRECKATRERLVYRAGKDAALTNEGAPE